MNKLHWSPEYPYECPVPQQQQQYMSKTDIEQQTNLMYPVSPFYASSPSASPTSVMYGNESFVTSPSYIHAGPGSPDSLMSLSAPIYQVPPPLVQSSSSSTIRSNGSTTSSAAATAYLNETIAKASALPESFYPEFLQYSKESFEQTTGRISKKRARSDEDKAQKQFSSDEDDEDEDQRQQQQRPARKQKVEQDATATSVSELRRQIHIQSEQKRRAQIKDGFEDLRTELPACLNKKMSKVTLLHRTVQHIQHLKSTQMTILAELERLVQENEQLRSFQQSVLQKQALENMYSIGNM
ncbi:uncharacterized protein B0P05DRAFT_523788 [Gilbertella persicaria]|uniref:uncharacterized protein n=1 Tax=Gilbertella persicaria TaxID=101096 RepID=UPI002220A82E|nr:uncharacterized protein B0P05DRAFT_523788 [Gilbertella persicaria]KAI8094880.1 hypothetical protein B0P05DRAFT_523788 [Gilbertella persicaria]